MVQYSVYYVTDLNSSTNIYVMLCKFSKVFIVVFGNILYFCDVNSINVCTLISLKDTKC